MSVMTSSVTEVWRSWEGKVIDGKFPLRQWLGGSAQSAVFLTQHGNQYAAIKLIPGNAENGQDQLSRWKLGAELSHPDLIRLFEMGHCQVDQQDLLYVVMEHAEENLSQVLPVRPLTPSEANDMLPPVVDALAYLHGRGLVHTAVKPSNIMAVRERLKLSSDGIYREGDVRDGQDQLSIYDAPETGREPFTPAADVWSLGVTLVAALTPPSAVWDKANSTSTLPDTIPQPFRDMARRCLRRDPRERCKLTEILNPPPPPAVAVPEPEPESTQAERARVELEKPPVNRSLKIPILAAILLLAALIGWRLTAHHPASSPQQVASEQPASGNAATQPASPVSAARAPSHAGVIPGKATRQVMPEVTRSALNSIHGKVKLSVRVNVSPSGDVSEARLQSAGPSQYFAGKSLAAARQWKFTPPQKDGRAVASQWLLHFQFTRPGIHAEPAQVSP